MSYSHSVPSFDLEMDIDVELQSTVPIKSKTPDTNTNILSTCSSNVNLNLPCAMRRTTAALTSSLALPGEDVINSEHGLNLQNTRECQETNKDDTNLHTVTDSFLYIVDNLHVCLAISALA
ncbi:unnamed protein product [Rotaria magnacalcarata]|uniref:Uncharacterized protein n=1 Tax=Rotaria magnacalcarata TaxID=392030 RepID=A0A820MZ42_9BILA|nr:unnamed protein product [Rotaria magnacalcarata]